MHRWECRGPDLGLVGAMKDIWILVLCMLLCTAIVSYRISNVDVHFVLAEPEPAAMTAEQSAKAILACRKHHMGHTEPLNKRGEVFSIQCTGWPSGMKWDPP